MDLEHSASAGWRSWTRKALRWFSRPLIARKVDVEVLLAQENYRQGDRISGWVVVHGARVDRTASSLRVELREFYQYDVYTEYGAVNMRQSQVRDQAELPGPHRFLAGEMRRMPFEAQLPRNARLTGQASRTVSGGWEVRARLRFGGWRATRTTVQLQVGLGQAFLSILAALERGPGFLENVPSRSWKSVDRPMRFKLTVPRHLSEEFRSVTLELFEQKDGTVTGAVVVRPPPHGFARLSSLMPWAGSERRRFSLTRQQILLPNGQSNSDAILTTLGRCLDEALAGNK